MQRETLPRGYFWLPYVLTIASIVMVGLEMAEAFPRAWVGWALVIGFMASAISVAAYGFRRSPAGLTTPERHSPQHFLMLLWHSVQSGGVAFLLHGGLYALFWHLACRLIWGHACAGDEPVFFVILLIVVPAGFVAGAVGRLWQWAVVQPIVEIETRGISLPTTSPYFAPIGSYIWLWKFSKGIEAITEKRIRAGGAFASVFFLGIIGFVIIQTALQRRLSRS
jgi:hypothetical protein